MFPSRNKKRFRLWQTRLHFELRAVSGYTAAAISAVCLTAIRPCLAHPEFIPRDLGAEAAGDLSAAAGAILLVTLLVFFAADKLIDMLVRLGRFHVGYWAAKVYLGIGACGFACLLWYCGVSIPFAARAAAMTAPHIDKPAHGGIIQAIGNRHFEAVLSPDRGFKLYCEGITPTVAAPIDQATLWAKTRSAEAGAQPSEMTAVLLHAAPQTGETAKAASLYTGELPTSPPSGNTEVVVTVPIDGTEKKVTFRFGKDYPATAAFGPAIPTHDTSATRIVATPITPEQQKLFLTPGGAYTAADIAANGSTTPEQRFGGQMANHHLSPKKGTIICPITRTQANPRFTWYVGGKPYLFCCPPCVTEFVKQAKTDPRSILAPEKYVQK